jgi:hypothetical protein
VDVTLRSLMSAFKGLERVMALLERRRGMVNRAKVVQSRRRSVWTTVAQALMRGLGTAFPTYVRGFPCLGTGIDHRSATKRSDGNSPPCPPPALHAKSACFWDRLMWLRSGSSPYIRLRLNRPRRQRRSRPPAAPAAARRAGLDGLWRLGHAFPEDVVERCAPCGGEPHTGAARGDTSRAIAQRKAAISRAIAVTTTAAGLPPRRSFR